MSSTAPNRIKSRLRNVVIALLAIYVLIGTFLYTAQKRMIFQGWYLPESHVYQFTHEFEEIFIDNPDGSKINAIHFKAQNPKGVILYFHGNAGHLQRWGEITGYLVDKGYDLFIMDYRGYGKSTGEIDESSLYEDAQRCYDHIAAAYEASRIYIYGRSLGTSMATKLAINNPTPHLILEAPFYSLADVAKYRFPIFPVEKLLKFELSNFKHLSEVEHPITIFHGTEDFVVPFDSGKKLADSFESKKVNFITIEGGGHSNLADFDTYQQELDLILK